ncbi:MAG: divalent-cation tolerance protein CutA [Alphaproteobacteria bacterium]
MSDYIVVYITASTKDEAVIIAQNLVAKKLVSCANILGDITSIYRWRNEIKNDKETAMIVKTKKTLLSDVLDEVKRHHSYECPCIISLPINGGSEDFLNWIGQETI